MHIALSQACSRVRRHMIYSPISLFDYCGEPIFQVKQYPSLFVSRSGKVFSFRSLVSGKHKLIRRVTLSAVSSNGSCKKKERITFLLNGRMKCVFVHRLICLTFCGDPPTEKHQVNHINEDTLDNRAENLEWVTPKENIRKYWNKRTKVKMTEYSQIENDTLRLLIRDGIRQYKIAEMIGVSRQAIHSRVNKLGLTSSES